MEELTPVEGKNVQEMEKSIRLILNGVKRGMILVAVVDNNEIKSQMVTNGVPPAIIGNIVVSATAQSVESFAKQMLNIPPEAPPPPDDMPPPPGDAFPPTFPPTLV